MGKLTRDTLRDLRRAEGDTRSVLIGSWHLCAALAMLSVWPSSAQAMEIVTAGKPKAIIVVPDDPLPVVTCAAQELQYHIKEATGAALAIVKENEKPTGLSCIYLGTCQETGRVGIRPEKLPPNAFHIRLTGNSFFLAGNDSEGQPFWIQHENRTRVGTLFAVYEFLDRHLGVRWLWPGKLGEVIPRRFDINVSRWDETHVPQIVHSRWRDGGAYSAGTAGWSSPQARSQYLQDQGIWLRRQRFAMGVNMDIRHSFTDYWKRFSADHPEYFNLLPDGTRRSDPYYWGGDAGLVSMCVSQPALWKQIVGNWKATRSPENPFIDVSENDTNAKCTCEQCLAWDVPDPKAPTTNADRLTAARRAFASGEPGWERFLGSLSDRYARFYLAVQREAERLDPNATVLGFAYANYERPPVRTKLNERIIIGIVPALMFPWTEAKRTAFHQQWDGWRAAGATLMLRPNYTLDGHNMPISYARKLGEDFTYAARRGLIATDFDSLTGQWATQGPNLYVLGRLHAHPDWPVTKVLEEYYQGFGKAANAVQTYFAHWEKVSDSVTDKTLEEAVKQRSAELGDWARFHRIAPSLFTSKVMEEGRSLLTKAKEAARGDAPAEQRVAFLEKGLRNAELTLAVQEAYERYKRNGDIAGYRKAMEALDTFRASVEREGVANMAYLAWAESNTWDRTLLGLLKQPGEPLPSTWKFQWDPDKRGEASEWFAAKFDDSGWLDIGIDSCWEKQEVGKKWKQEHGSDYDGLAWYRTRFILKPAASPQQVRLVFGAVDEACTIWVNGQLALERPFPFQGNMNSWQEAFEADVTDLVHFTGANTLAVRVEDNVGAGGVWKPVWLVQSAAPVGVDQNVVKDGGFEQTPSAWSNQTQCGAIAYAIDSSQSHSGKASARIVCTELGPPEVQSKFRTRAWGRWYQTGVPVQPGKAYRLRLWAKTSNEFNGRIRVWVVVGGEEGTKEVVVLNTEGIWKEIVMERIVPQSTTVALYLNLMEGVGSVWFDNVELVEAVTD